MGNLVFTPTNIILALPRHGIKFRPKISKQTIVAARKTLPLVNPSPSLHISTTLMSNTIKTVEYGVYHIETNALIRSLDWYTRMLMQWKTAEYSVAARRMLVFDSIKASTKS